MGRKTTYKPDEVAEKLMQYIADSDDPYIEEFCLMDGNPCKDTIYRLEKDCRLLSDAIKRCHEKQKLRTVRAAENGEINSTFAIFKLKQKCYGWTDKVETVNTNLNHEMSEAEADEILKRFGVNDD